MIGSARNNRLAEPDEPEYFRQYLDYFDKLGWTRLPAEENHIEGDWDEGTAGNRPAVSRILRSPRSRHYRQFA